MAQRHGVLVPGRPMPTHPVVKVAVKTFRYERVEMTTVRWFILAFALEAIIIATLCMIGSATGRFGPHKIQGGSATDFAPQGSVVWSWPMAPKIDDRVMAWVNGDPAATDQADRQPSLVLKRFRGDAIGLDSTTASTKYLPGQYEVRSVVLAVWHTEKWFPWLNTGTQVPGRSRTAAEQKAIDDRKEALASGHSATEEAKGFIEAQGAILGPIETRPVSVSFQVPKGAKQVRWNLSVPPVKPEADVEIRLGSMKKVETAPVETPAGVNGLMGAKEGQKLNLRMTRGEAVAVSLRFYK